jgi:hypothetical protein
MFNLNKILLLSENQLQDQSCNQNPLPIWLRGNKRLLFYKNFDFAVFLF